jgi:EAL domain-containing protein (putative c-di-GMP-specific phosphodiesterase class I)
LRFIPLAEETALIARLDRYVLRQACRQARAWQELVGRSFRLAVNLSARQFQRADLLAVVEAALHDSGLSPDCLELEITETVAMQSAERTARILSELRSTGVSIALDDFGTGFSSLSHLRQLPINRLKVDCSFVANLENDPGAAAIVKAVLGMGETLGIDVLAEGVETRAQAEYLIAAGCREAQGFLFARPLSPADCEEVLLSSDLSRVG